jgi:quercetin dioxygenase-like cupin family protein
MHTQFPKTIETLQGEKITFLRVETVDGQERLIAENHVKPKAGPPMHVHHLQDECLTVVSGTMAYQVPGEEPKYAGPGETVLFEKGVWHKFWNAGADELVCTGYVSPVGNVMYFLTEVYRSLNQHGGRPGLYDAAYLLTRYKSEFGMGDIPPFVQKVIFPVVLFFGNLMGKSRKFKGAPVPMK